MLSNLPKIKDIYNKSNLFYKEANIKNLDCVIVKRTETIFFGCLEYVTFITIGESSQIITKEIIRDFSNACFESARINYDGRGLGRNSGVISISVLLGSNVSQTAKEFCKRGSERHWASRQIHIIYDQSNNEFYNYSGWQIWGGAIIPYYRKLSSETMDIVRTAVKA